MKRDGDIEDIPMAAGPRADGSTTVGSGTQERRVAALLADRDRFADTGAFLKALLALLREEDALGDGTLARVGMALDAEDDDVEEDDEDAREDAEAGDGAGQPHGVLARFWAALSERFPDSALAAACHGNALLREGHDQEAMARVDTALHLDPQVVLELDDVAGELARSRGGPAWLRFQLAELRAMLASIEAAAADRAAAEAQVSEDAREAAGEEEDEDDPTELGEEARERYSELLEEYRQDPTSLAQIREVGTIITALERDGILPQTMIRRGTSRR